jgi:galactonate dehydratase
MAGLADFLQADNPAANVADRSSTIRIKSLTTFPLGPKVFVKIETNHGVTGWGEIDQLEPVTAAALAKSLFELLDNENPTRIEHLWQKLYRSHRDMRGGPTRDKLRLYPGPKATKTGAGPAEFSGTPAEIERYVKLIEQARKQVGPEGMVMFDAHCALPPPFLIQLAAAIEPQNVLFIEEVGVPGNIEVFKRLKQAIKIPLATGERDRTIWEMLPYFQEGCIDVLQPDCAHTGGITQMRKIATLAEAYFVPLAPHCVTTELGVAASFHATAAIPFFLIHEYYPSLTPPGIVKKSWTVEDGHASLPEGPGLGVEIDEKALSEYKPKNPWKWPDRGRLKDGSISDY